VATVALLAVHYLAFGPKHREVRRDKRDVRRFSLWERLIQAATLATFLILAVSGLGSAIGLGKPVLGWWGVVHVAMAPAFAACLGLLALTWADPCRFGAHDWTWAKGLGGYLWGEKDLPAGRFNAEEKTFLWAAAALTIVAILSGLGRMHPLFGPAGQHALYETHRYSTLLLVLLVIVHIYLTTLASPGGGPALLSGKVSANWAKHHHSLWWEAVQQEPADDNAQQESKATS
jgi:formate dehydrogenase subunit gamma